MIFPVAVRVEVDEHGWAYNDFCRLVEALDGVDARVEVVVHDEVDT